MATCDKCGQAVAKEVNDERDGDLPLWMQLGLKEPCSNEEANLIMQEEATRSLEKMREDELAAWFAYWERQAQE